MQTAAILTLSTQIEVIIIVKLVHLVASIATFMIIFAVYAELRSIIVHFTFILQAIFVD